MNQTKLVQGLVEMLKHGIFESESRARAQYPDPFNTSPSGEEQQQAHNIEAHNIEAAQSEVEALERIE